MSDQEELDKAYAYIETLSDALADEQKRTSRLLEERDHDKVVIQDLQHVVIRLIDLQLDPAPSGVG